MVKPPDNSFWEETLRIYANHLQRTELSSWEEASSQWHGIHVAMNKELLFVDLSLNMYFDPVNSKSLSSFPAVRGKDRTVVPLT